jgi:hypothetical protein
MIAILTLIFLKLPASTLGTQAVQAQKSPEIEKILALKSTQAQSKELLKLLERVGPVETQEEMLHWGLPFTGETHLLVHTVGDYIYDTYGPSGLTYCKDYFLSACYHALIIDTLGDHGMAGMVDVMAKCFEAGGHTVAAQCAHGAGHGFVAWQDYDLVKALKMCDELESKSPNFPSFNCYDGVFMENVWGVHNGTPSEKRWVSEDDIYYPCDDPRIPKKYLNGCWSNQATLLYQRFKGDLKKTAEACDAVPEPEYRETCYNNFARQIHPLTHGSVEKVFSLCSNATGGKWQDYCVLTNMGAYWSVGDHELPEKICQATTGMLQQSCFKRLEALKSYN